MSKRKEQDIELDEILEDIPNDYDKDKNNSNSKDSKELNLMTLDFFLSNHREIKQKYNKYIIIGFRHRINTERIENPGTPYRRTYEDWMQRIIEYAGI